MNLTPQQAAAVTTQGRALLVEAGAGTGKTAVLVERFLHLLDRRLAWPIDSIVAVTFTEKATREMRSRIRAGVEARAAAAGPNSPWQERRRELDRLAVGTIHGLCARILKDNPIAAQIDPRFTVLGEEDTALLREQAVRQALSELASGLRSPNSDTDPPDRHDPLDLLADFEVQDLHEQMIRLLGQRGTVDRLFARLPGKDDLLAEWQVRVREMQSAIWSEQLSLNPAYGDALDQIARLPITDLADKLAEHVRAAQDGCECANRGDFCAASSVFSRIKLNVGGQAAWGGKDALREIKDQLRLLRELGACLTGKGYDQPVGPNDERAAEALQCWRVLWKYVTGVYDNLKDGLAALDFDDLERLAHKLLTAQPRDERVQATIDSINHLMVDEFQDVNEVQGEILTALADLSADGRFFGVGDAKQSIYRFRQAQVKVFNQVGREIAARTDHEPLPLNRSFRTHAALVACVNEAFEKVLRPVGATHEDFEARPGALEPERPPLEPCEAAPGCVEVIVLPPGLADASRREEAALLARRLHELVAKAFPVWDRDVCALRPARYGDIAILFRATTSLPLYEEVFKAEGLPYLTVSGRGYYDRPEVRDLTALLACLHNPADDLSTASVLRSPMFNLSDETLYQLRFTPIARASADVPISFTAALEAALIAPPACAQTEPVLAAAETFKVLRAAAGRVAVWTILRTALDRTGYEATLALADLEATTRTAAGGGRARANVAKFLQLARDRGGANLSAFLQAVQNLRAREAREGEALPDAPDAGAVQLMSIHAAKGLEFPVVVLADLGRVTRTSASPRILYDPTYQLACQVRDEHGDWVKPVSYGRAEWLDGRMEQAESKRLLYVACTRAADLLILSGSAKRDSWLETLADAWELDLSEESDEERTADREQLVEAAGYRLRVVWPARPAEADSRTIETRAAKPTSAPSLVAPPPLSLPLPPLKASWPVAVTHLPEDSESAEDGDEELPQLRPVVLVDGMGAKGRRPWRFLVGNLAHRALAHWDCLAQPDEVLHEMLIRWARRGGLFEPADVAAAVGRVNRLLHTLRSTPLHREICAARERHAEVPLSIRVDGQVLHGILDLLYLDETGQWRLLDWKTEPVGKEQTLQEAARPYLRQMAVYSQAVEQILGFKARAEICFLSERASVYTPSREELLAEWYTLSREP